MSIPAASTVLAGKCTSCAVFKVQCTVWTRARYGGEWWCLRRRVRGLDRLRAAFDLDNLDRLGAALDLDGLDRLGVTYPPVAFDPEALWH